MGSFTVTILFSDVVASTELLRVPADADVVRRRLFSALRKAVVTYRGEEVKNLGDGLMVAFASTVDAVQCAVAMQQAVFRLRPVAGDAPVQIRVGVSVGEATREDGDYFGTPVVEAARLCAAASAGQTLVSDLVRLMAGSRAGHPFRGMGSLELKGLPEPVATSEVRWTPAAELPMPATLAAATRTLFVGRGDVLAALEAARMKAAEGERRTVVLAGEPGIGKTRLVAAAAAAAHGRGCTVLYGRCDQGLGVPYQPFVEILRHYVRGCDDDTLAAHVATHRGELARLVPELRERVPELPEPVMAEPEGDRLRLFEAVDGLVGLASHETPALLLVVEDLHWADRSTLLLLGHLVRSVEPSPILLVATYRDTDVGPGHPLTSTLADLTRCPAVERLGLTGLDGAEVTELFTKAAGHELDEIGRNLATRVQAETRGNPFFVAEVLRHLVETGTVYQRDGTWTSDVTLAQVGIPEGVRDVVRGRLSRLSPAGQRVLEVAAVAGSQFSVELLERTGSVGRAAEIVGGLDDALGARLVIEGSEPGPRTYTFAHAIVRQTIYSDLSSARRAQLHQAVGDAIAQLHGPDDGADVAALAHHFSEAAPVGRWAEAADYSLRAARLASDQMAHDEAALVLERGLRALDTAERPDLDRRCDLLLALAQVRVRALDPAGTRQASLAAAEAARAIGSPDRLAEAAYWYSVRSVAGERDETGIEMVEEALAGMADAPPGARARALAVLAQLRSFAGESEAGDELSREALGLAGQTSDAEAMALAAYARYQSLWGSERAAEQLALAEQLLECPVVMPSGWLASVDAHRLVSLARLALGDLEGFGRGTEELERIGAELKSRYFLTLASLWRTCRALLEGRFADVEALVEKTGALAGEDRNFRNGIAAQLFYLSFERGTLAPLKPLIVQVLEATPGLVAFKAALALTHVELGETAEARAVFEDMAGDRFAAVPRDLVWPGSMSLLCEVCAGVGDGERAAVLHDLFASHSGLLVVTANGLHCPGAVDRYLGMMAATAGGAEQAEAHYQAALQLEERIGASPLVARTGYWYAQLLLDGDRPGDRGRAAELLSRTLATANELGMRRLGQQVVTSSVREHGPPPANR